MADRVVIVCFVVVFAVLLQESISSHGRCVDQSVHQCQNIMQPHHCYEPRNVAMCCATCRRYRTHDPGCLYGDRNAVIKRGGRSFTCRGYVGHFGRTRCQDYEFYRLCCSSCIA